MELAKTKFTDISHSLKVPYRPDVIKLVCNSTPDSVDGLRQIVQFVCTKLIEVVLQDDEVCSEIESHSGMLREILCQVVNWNTELLMNQVRHTMAVQDEVCIIKKKLNELVSQASELSLPLRGNSSDAAWINCQEALDHFRVILAEVRDGVKT